MNKQNFSKIFTILFVFAFLYYGFNNKEIFTQLKYVPLVALILIAIGRLIVFVINGLFTKWTAEAFTRKLTVGEGIYVGILSAIGNFFGPLLGGASIRAVYLKKVHDLSYSNFTSTLVGYYMILFIINCVAALLSLFLLPQTYQTQTLITFFALWLVVLLTLIIIKLPSREKFIKLEKKKPAKSAVKILYDVESGWHTLIKNKNLLLKMFYLATGSYVASLFISFVEFKAIGAPINMAALGLYTAVVAISLLLSFTPGSIGIREGLLLIVSVTVGLTGEQILQIAVIDRGVMFALLFLLFLITRSKRLRRAFTEKDIRV